MASQLLMADPARPTVVGDPDEFISLARPEGTPASIYGYLHQDREQLGLHVVAFTNVTPVLVVLASKLVLTDLRLQP